MPSKQILHWGASEEPADAGAAAADDGTAAAFFLARLPDAGVALAAAGLCFELFAEEGAAGGRATAGEGEVGASLLTLFLALLEAVVDGVSARTEGGEEAAEAGRDEDATVITGEEEEEEEPPRCFRGLEEGKGGMTAKLGRRGTRERAREEVFFSTFLMERTPLSLYSVGRAAADIANGLPLPSTATPT